ncbi:MAG: hypothetical protein ACXAB7_07680 [Candidatus Kariarchaeaceae archaeon]
MIGYKVNVNADINNQQMNQFWDSFSELCSFISLRFTPNSCFVILGIVNDMNSKLSEVISQVKHSIVQICQNQFQGSITLTELSGYALENLLNITLSNTTNSNIDNSIKNGADRYLILHSLEINGDPLDLFMDVLAKPGTALNISCENTSSPVYFMTVSLHGISEKQLASQQKSIIKMLSSNSSIRGVISIPNSRYLRKYPGKMALGLHNNYIDKSVAVHVSSYLLTASVLPTMSMNLTIYPWLGRNTVMQEYTRDIESNAIIHDKPSYKKSNVPPTPSLVTQDSMIDEVRFLLSELGCQKFDISTIPEFGCYKIISCLAEFSFEIFVFQSLPPSPPQYLVEVSEMDPFPQSIVLSVIYQGPQPTAWKNLDLDLININILRRLMNRFIAV